MLACGAIDIQDAINGHENVKNLYACIGSVISHGHLNDVICKLVDKININQYNDDTKKADNETDQICEKEKESLKKVAKKQSRRRKRERQKQKKRQQEQKENSSSIDNERPSCVVCLDESPSHVIVPCGHVCVCDICISSLNHCPLCRVEITQTLRVFF